MLSVTHNGRRIGVTRREDGFTQLLIDNRTEILPREYRREAAPLRGNQKSIALAPPADSAIMTILVAVTPNVESANGGPDGTTAFAQLLVADTNQAYADSGITARLQAVGTYVLPNYQATSDTVVDLQRLQRNGDGYYDGVHAARASVAADLVALIGNYTTACGQGYLTCSGPECFTVSDRQCAVGNFTFAHEVGHNQGMHHDPPNGSGGGQYASYSFGFVDPAYVFRTILAYPTGGSPRVRRFSNPLLTYNGKPTGTTTQDNARTLNARAATVANFGGAGSTPTPTPTPKPCKGRKCR